MGPARSTVPHAARDDLARIVGIGVVLGGYLARMRVYQALDVGGESASVVAGNIAVALRPDLLYTAALMGTLGVAVWAARRRPGIRRVLVGLWVVLAAFSVLAAQINRIAVGRLGQPLSYQWLYYSDFLTGIDAFNTMAGVLSWKLLATIAAKCAAVVAVGWLGGRWLASWLAAGRIRLVIVVGAATVAIAVPLAAWLARGATLPSTRAQNPLVFLAGSALRPEGGSLSGRTTKVGVDDFQAVGERAVSSSSLAGAAQRNGVRNVILFVMESVSARFVGAYGGPPGLTPEIDAAAAHARVFTRLYAHVPSTAHSLVSLLLSAYHPHSFHMLTREFPRVALPSLSGELDRRGYRTAFFNSADNRFQRGDEFLSVRGFDFMADHRSLRCARRLFIASSHDWPFLDGTQDGCAVDALLDWVGTSSAEPFAAVLWTMQTHDPYFVSEPEGRYAREGSPLNRHLSALHEGDRALGSLLRGLEARHLLESTLVIVMGDHGEAFGEHGHTNHHFLYQEDLHIPFLIINGRLFAGERDSTVGGIIDVAPTVMDLLGYPLPARWQGRSLFDRARSGRVYLFAPFSSVYFGFVEGSRKLIYDANVNTAELYDLEEDPQESENLAGADPARVRLGVERLVAWARYQKGYYAGLLDRSAR